MNIIYFAHTTNAPSTRYRGKYVLIYLKKKYDINYQIIYPKKRNYIFIAFLIAKSKFFSAKKETIFIFQKMSIPSRYVALLKILLKSVEKSYYDIDDAMYTIKQRKETVNFFASNASNVLTSSENLVQYFQQINPKTHFLTTPVLRATSRKKKKKNIFTIGWIGIFKTHKENLFEILFPALKSLKIPIQLTLLGVQNLEQKSRINSYFLDCPNIILKIPMNINWECEEKIFEKIAEFDVGVMPLLDTQINKSKSSFKIKQYFSVGVPVLASPIGENIKYVKNGYNGFLCDIKEEWIKNILLMSNLEDIDYMCYSNNAFNFYQNSDFTLEIVGKQLYKIFLE